MDAGAIDMGLSGSDLLDRPDTVNHQRVRSAEEARAVAQDFEAMFLSQMLQPMFAGISTDAPFGGGNAEKVYRALLVQEYGRSLSESGGIGLADDVAKELMQWQEGQSR